MTASALTLRTLQLAALMLLVGLELCPLQGRAQNSAAAAVTGPATGHAALSPAAMNAVLGTNKGCNNESALKADQAFQVAAVATGPDSVRIDWRIADNCYLYRNRFKVTAAGEKLGALALPEGKTHTDEFFGTQQIYENSVSATLPVIRTNAAGDRPLTLDVSYQGCSHSGFCYPPITKTLVVSLPAAAASGSTGGTGTLLAAAVGAAGAGKSCNNAPNDFLTADQAFQVAAAAAGPDSVRIDWHIAEGCYLYRSRIKVKTASPVQLGTLALPEGKSQTDEYFGAQQIYEHSVSATLPVARATAAGPQDLALDVTYQGCAHAGLCYPPITKTLAVTLPPAGAAGGGTAAAAPDAAAGVAAAPSAATGFVSQQDRLAGLIRNGNLLLMIATFFASGLVLAFTPCVLPMVPILSGIIAGHGANVTTSRAFGLSLSYVLGMACTYTLAGIAVAAAGAHVQALFQQTWVVVLFAGLFVLLSLSMFGVYTLQMPTAIQTRLTEVSSRQAAGTFGGVAVMGALSALIVTTCVAAPLVATYVVIGQSGNMLRGATALFALSLGMGTPLLVVGASQGKLLPKAGPWMDTIKQLFGVMMLCVADWMLARVVPPAVVLLMWAIPAAACAWVLWRGARGMRQMPILVRTVAVAAGAYAVVLIVGSRMGGTDPLMPIPALAGQHPELAFRTIKSTGDLDREVAQAQAGGHAVMVDFYADWCVSCKEMEKYTFTDPAVQATLRNVVLLRANVTANDLQDQALMKRFDIIGPPTIAFYGADGHERAPYRVVGFMKAPDFAALSRRAVSS
ncbi:MAG: protein-disulfide reductase DsbD [Steroidobacteraceae bacterium]